MLFCCTRCSCSDGNKRRFVVALLWVGYKSSIYGGSSTRISSVFHTHLYSMVLWVNVARVLVSSNVIEITERRRKIATKEHKETQRTRTQKKNFYKNSLTKCRPT